MDVTKAEIVKLDFSQRVNTKAKVSIASKGNQIPEWPRFSTGSLSLDAELGGGIPKGNIIGIVGEFSSGKTAAALKMVAEYQKQSERPVVWVDAEGAWDPRWAQALGVDIAAITVVRPRFGEEAYDVILSAFDDYRAGLVVLDSAGALASKKELEGNMDDIEVAGMSKIHAKFMRKIDKSWQGQDEDPPTFIFLNQYIQNVGGYGGPLVEKGGKALTEYFPAVKIQFKTGDYVDATSKVMRSVAADQEGVELKGQAIKFYITKNKTAPPKRRGHFWFYFDTIDANRKKGDIDKLEECVRLAKKYDLVDQRGKMYDLLNEDTGELRTFEGINNLTKFIREDDRARDYIEKKVLQKVTGEMKGEKEPREDRVSEEHVAQLRVIRDNEEEGEESSEAV